MINVLHSICPSCGIQEIVHPDHDLCVQCSIYSRPDTSSPRWREATDDQIEQLQKAWDHMHEQRFFLQS